MTLAGSLYAKQSPSVYHSHSTNTTEFLLSTTHLAKCSVYRNKDSRGPTPTGVHRTLSSPLSPYRDRRRTTAGGVPGEPAGDASPPTQTAASPLPAITPPPPVQARADRNSIFTLPASQLASLLARPLGWAGQCLHGNRTQTIYPGRPGRLPAEPGSCWTGGVGQGMSWEWAQGRGLPARPKAPVGSGRDSDNCGDSAHPLAFPRRRRQQQQPPRAGGAQQGGAGRGGSERSLSPRWSTGLAQVSPTHA